MRKDPYAPIVLSLIITSVMDGQIITPNGRLFLGSESIPPEQLVRVTAEDCGWFLLYAEAYAIWLYRNQPDWRKKFYRIGNKQRDLLTGFIGHWWAAFCKNPEEYKKRHTMEELA